MRAAVLLLAALLATGSIARAAETCPSNKVPPLVLPTLKKTIEANAEATIVAFGSSSTAGYHASDIAHSYPAMLQAGLAGALPHGHVAVINRGIGGEDATNELPRIERDVLSVHPSVVIWQVGANGAMRHVPVDVFRRMVETGVRRLQAAKIDVVLMDNQQAPKILAAPEHVKIAQALADVSVATGAGLFSRGALMDQWRNSGFPYADFMSDDGIHHNDHGYACVAAALVQAIIDGLDPSPAPAKALARR